MPESSLNAALRTFEAVEANLSKAERVWRQVQEAIPTGIAFGSDPTYDDLCRTLTALVDSLPAMGGEKPQIELMDLDEIAQCRLDAQEIMEIGPLISLNQQLEQPTRVLGEYRFNLEQRRRKLVRDAMTEQIDVVDGLCRVLGQVLSEAVELNQEVDHPQFGELRGAIAQVATLLGGSTPKPERFGDMLRHLHFGTYGDLQDILRHDWPSVRPGLRDSLYGQDDALPVDVDDLDHLIDQKPSGPVATRLNWDSLSEEGFERLIFALISSEPGYENAEWLTRTSATDRGRDMSAYRVHSDGLAGSIRDRVIVQCKHWRSRSVAPADVTALRDQMALWEPPRVDVCVIATSGRFTTDAVDLVETHNQKDKALRIEMWPDSKLELLLAERPTLIAEFGLR